MAVLKRLSLVAAALASFLVGRIAVAQPSASLSSPMIDHSLFRDGAIHRTARRFGDWTVVCDEIKGLNRRYCSLRSAAASVVGGTVYADVSTGDDGKAAALLHLPVAISIPFGVLTTAAGEGIRSESASLHPAVSHRLGIVQCDDHECLVVWALSAAQIDAFNDGRGIDLVYCRAAGRQLEFTSNLRANSCASKTTQHLSGSGFKAAVLSSLSG